jgi:SulP family sulfate permease
LDFQAVSFVDITGVDELHIMLDELKTKGIQIALIGIHLPVMEVLKNSGMINELNHSHLFENKGDAISFLFQHIDHGYCQNKCPHKLYHECSTIK